MLNTANFTRLSSWCRSARQACYTKIARSSRKTRIIGASSLFLAATAFGAAGFAPSTVDNTDIEVERISKQLALPDLDQQILAVQDRQQSYTHLERVRSGDTLGTLLNRIGVSDKSALQFIRTDSTAQTFMQLRAGHRVVAKTTENGTLLHLSTTVGEGAETRDLVITRDGDRFTAKEVTAQLERRLEMRSGTIRSSLFAATDSAGIPDSIASQIVDMFATSINFAQDLRRGDSFHIVYESFWHNGHPVRTGRVLAGEFVNSNHTYQALWYDESGNGNGSYYTMDGRSTKRAFLRSPLPFTRITSGFALRKHPILGKWKRHTGVDFGAPTGTPIRAAGEGVVHFKGWQNGYGNIVILRHWNGYSTAYAHMSRFAKIKKGDKVSQGQLIGYVGATGWATGPHLHYEFRVNNRPIDPMSVKVPNAQPLTKAQLQRFKQTTADMSRRLALLRVPENQKHTQLAQAK